MKKIIDHRSYKHNLIKALSSQLKAQLEELSTGITEVIGSNPVQACILFRL